MGLVDSLFGGGGASAPEFKAYSTSSGLGDFNVKGDQITTKLSPEYRQIVEQLVGAFGGASPSYSPETLGLGKAATQTGAGFLESLGSYDPFAAAEEQFNRMDAILAKGRERDRTALEEKLLRQGRLGSTGGGISEEALAAAQEDARQKSLIDAFGQAQGVQAQKAQLAQSFGAFGGSIEDQQLQRLLQSLGTATSLEAMPSQIGAAGNQLTSARAQYNLGKTELDNANQGAGWGDIVGGVLSGGATTLGTAGGKALAKWAFG